MTTEDRPIPRAGWRRRLVLGAAIVVVGLPAASLLTATAAAAAPTLVQSPTGVSVSDSTVNQTVSLTDSFNSACQTGDTLIAMVTIGQQAGEGGMVAAVPAGWQRIYEHSPTDSSPYQGWYALSGCSGQAQVTFDVVSPGNSSGTTGSLVVAEFSGLPHPVAQDFAVNDGSSSNSTTWPLTGQTPSSSGELVLTALSFYGNGSSPSSSTPSGWSAASSVGTSSTPLPAYMYWKTTGGSAPSATFNWSPSAAFEVTMLALKAGPLEGTPNVVQENQLSFSGSSGPAVTLSNGVTAGDALVALVATTASGSGTGFEATGVSGGGVTWGHVVAQKESSGGTAEVWVGFDSSGTSGSTPITVSFSSGQTGSAVVSEITNIVGIDTTNSNASGSGSPSLSLTPSGGDVMVALATMGSSLVVHPQPDWSTYSLSSGSIGPEWESNVPNSSVSPSWTTSGSAPWAAVVAAFNTAPPTVTGISPSVGKPAGGATVTITGTNLGEAQTVDFGTRPASFTVNSATSITATSPSSSQGTFDVTVTTPQGTSATSSADHFTFTNAPTVTGISPSTGPSAGGTSVTITGINFTGATGVQFGAAAASSFQVNGDTQVTATSPAGSAGTVDVTVTVGAVTSATGTADEFTYGPPPGPTSGYWMVGSDGGVFAFGNAGFEGSLPGLGVHVKDIVGVVPTADHGGYWMVGSDGGVFAFGDATFKGSLPGLGVHVSDIVGVVPTADGQGYWMVGSDGGVFAFGDATFKGSLPQLGVHVKNIRAVVPTHDNQGYWMIGTDGGVFAFGDAGFVGSLPGLGVHVSNVVGAVGTADGQGYLMVGTDGGVFAFGDAVFSGSLPQLGVHVNNIVAVVPS